jgi:hypothetical protein
MPTAMLSCSYTSLRNSEYKFWNCSSLSKCCKICKVQFFCVYTICISNLALCVVTDSSFFPEQLCWKIRRLLWLLQLCCNFGRHYPILQFCSYRSYVSFCYPGHCCWLWLMYFAICITIDPNSQIFRRYIAVTDCRKVEVTKSGWRKNSIVRKIFHQNPLRDSRFEVPRPIWSPLYTTFYLYAHCVKTHNSRFVPSDILRCHKTSRNLKFQDGRLACQALKAWIVVVMWYAGEPSFEDLK